MSEFQCAGKGLGGGGARLFWGKPDIDVDAYDEEDGDGNIMIMMMFGIKTCESSWSGQNLVRTRSGKSQSTEIWQSWHYLRPLVWPFDYLTMWPFLTWLVVVEHEEELAYHREINCLEHFPNETQRTKVDQKPDSFTIMFQLTTCSCFQSTTSHSRQSFARQSSLWWIQSPFWWWRHPQAGRSTFPGPWRKSWGRQSRGIVWIAT